LFEAHGGRMLVAIKNSSPLTSILSPFGGARKKICKRAPPTPSPRPNEERAGVRSQKVFQCLLSMQK
jgi:hypothetical protein